MDQQTVWLTDATEISGEATEENPESVPTVLSRPPKRDVPLELELDLQSALAGVEGLRRNGVDPDILARLAWILENETKKRLESLL